MDNLKKAMEVIKAKGVEILKRQGHENTGKLINDMEIRLTEASVSLYGWDYGLAQETGIKKENHPFHGGSGVGDYIENLTTWIQNKGIESDIIKAKGIAFAIGKRQSGKGLLNGGATGMHSSGGKGRSAFDISKQGWLSTSIEVTQTEVDTLISEGAEKKIRIMVDRIWDEAKRNLGNTNN